MLKKKKCYIYTRISTAIQVDGYSLDAQKDKLCKYAEYQDMTVVSEFSDEGFSGKNIKGRPEFSRMMEKIESGEDNIDFVSCFLSDINDMLFSIFCKNDTKMMQL